MWLLNGKRWKTSCMCSCLFQDVVQLLVCWFWTKSEPCERVVFVFAEELFERLRSVPADARGVVVGHQYYVRPAVHVSDRLERMGKSTERPSNTDHRVIGLWAMKRRIGTSLREEWTIPVRHDVSGYYTHWIQQCTQKKLSYRKQIAHKLRTQYVDGILDLEI